MNSRSYIPMWFVIMKNWHLHSRWNIAVCSAFGFFSFCLTVAPSSLGQNAVRRLQNVCHGASSVHSYSVWASSVRCVLIWWNVYSYRDSSFFPRYHLVIIFPVSILSSPWNVSCVPSSDQFSGYTQCLAWFYSFSYSLSQIWTLANPKFSIEKL